EQGVLWQIADVAFQGEVVTHHLVAGYPNFARGGIQAARDDLKQGCLASSVLSKQSHCIAGFQVKANGTKPECVSKMFFHIYNLENLAHLRPVKSSLLEGFCIVVKK